MKFIDRYIKKTFKKDFDLTYPKVLDICEQLKNKSCIGNEMLGWQDLNADLKYIKTVSEEINSNADYILIIGIGGSYLGARMATDFLNPINKKKIFFIGYNLDSEYLLNILDICQESRVHVVVVSKSGNTIEIKATLDVIMDFMQKKYPENLHKHFTAITGKKGFLKTFSQTNNWKILDIPENVGGRFSVLTNAGLLPIAISGANIEKIIEGALEIKQNLEESTNNCQKYATIRNILYNNGFKIELFSSFNLRLVSLLEWLKQLFGESEGKNGKGLFPASVIFSTDLHSLGQFIQEGSKVLFETMIFVKNPGINLELSGRFGTYKSFGEINKKIFDSSLTAHCSGDVSCNVIEIEEFSEREIGRLVYFFEFSCALSALTLGVNPFNQPGVEIYKKIMVN